MLLMISIAITVNNVYDALTATLENLLRIIATVMWFSFMNTVPLWNQYTLDRSKNQQIASGTCKENQNAPDKYDYHSLKELLENPMSHEKFRSFLQSSFCEENLQFHGMNDAHRSQNAFTYFQ